MSDTGFLALAFIAVVVVGALIWFWTRSSAENKALFESVREMVPVDALREVYKDAYEMAQKTQSTKLDDLAVRIAGEIVSGLRGADVTTVPTPPGSTVTVSPPDATIPTEVVE